MFPFCGIFCTKNADNEPLKTGHGGHQLLFRSEIRQKRGVSTTTCVSEEYNFHQTKGQLLRCQSTVLALQEQCFWYTIYYVLRTQERLFGSARTVLLKNCTTAPGVQEPSNCEEILKIAFSALLVCEKSESRFLAVFYYKSGRKSGRFNSMFPCFNPSILM